MSNVTCSDSAEKQGKVSGLPSVALLPFGAFCGFNTLNGSAWQERAMVAVAAELVVSISSLPPR